jgi:hypothetical protein
MSGWPSAGLAYTRAEVATPMPSRPDDSAHFLAHEIAAELLSPT